MSDKLIWQEEIKECVKRTRQLEINLNKACGVFWGQCSSIMKEKLQQHKDFKDADADQDALKLLGMIRKIDFKCPDEKCIFATVHNANRRFCIHKQDKNDTNVEFKKKSDNLV